MYHDVMLEICNRNHQLLKAGDKDDKIITSQVV